MTLVTDETPAGYQIMSQGIPIPPDHVAVVHVQGRVDDTHRQIHGKVHGGGPLLKVRTGSGDIHIG